MILIFDCCCCCPYYAGRLYDSAKLGAIELREHSRLPLWSDSLPTFNFREPRRWTRTTKLLNSNSWMRTNNRFELLFELFKTFITISKLRLSGLQLRSLPVGAPLHLRTIWSCLFGGSSILQSLPLARQRGSARDDGRNESLVNEGQWRTPMRRRFSGQGESRLDAGNHHVSRYPARLKFRSCFVELLSEVELFH